ncbi:MAG: KH domain-containing protein [Nanoarchaeota archaeon]|mgnify:FL=1
MKKLILEKLPRVVKNRKKLEGALDVKIVNRGKEVFIEGEPLDEYIAEKVLDALELGFPMEVALLIKEEEMVLEIINIKDYTKRKDLGSIRARIIGKDGKTLRTLTNLTNCNFEINDNVVGIIGDAEDIETAQTALISLIKGSKQANVYAYLEKHQPKPIIDLGLKE